MQKKYLISFIFTILAISLNTNASFADSSDDDPTAHQAAGKFELLDLKSLPAWEKDEYDKMYDEIRDKKFLSYDGEARRIPWLYARDGCHMRSTHFNQEAKRLGYKVPKKIFIFGSLQMRGTIIPYGAVDPWFHAAPIIQVDGEPMVLDPAVSFSRPLPLKTWISYVAKDLNKVIYSICSSGTYMQTSSCYNPGPIDTARLNKETQLYLRFERNILKNLGLSFN
jgi:hypothetical protein